MGPSLGGRSVVPLFSGGHARGWHDHELVAGPHLGSGLEWQRVQGKTDLEERPERGKWEVFASSQMPLQAAQWSRICLTMQERQDPPEEEMAPHSSILAWEIPWTEEPGGLWSVGSHRVGHS